MRVYGGHRHVPEDGAFDAHVKGRLPVWNRNGKPFSRRGLRIDIGVVSALTSANWHRHKWFHTNNVLGVADFGEACMTQVEKKVPCPVGWRVRKLGAYQVRGKGDRAASRV
jgi:hypothetical protein